MSDLCAALSSGEGRAQDGEPETEGREWSFNPGHQQTVQVRQEAGRARWEDKGKQKAYLDLFIQQSRFSMFYCHFG